jgi:glutaredoxin 3
MAFDLARPFVLDVPETICIRDMGASGKLGSFPSRLGLPKRAQGFMADLVTLYTKRECPFCGAAREELDAGGVTYTEINVSDHPERIPELLKLTRGRRLVPVIVDGGGISVAPKGGGDF